MLLFNPAWTTDPDLLPPAPVTSMGVFGQAQLVVYVTTHEILHQWFGDTVTMRDWSQEYLNEGFARLMQSVGADDLVPGWDTTCLTGRTQAESNALYRFSYEKAMAEDALGTTPPIACEEPTTRRCHPPPTHLATFLHSGPKPARISRRTGVGDPDALELDVRCAR